MKQTLFSKNFHVNPVTGVAIAISAIVLSGCATAPGYNSGVQLPGGGSVGLPMPGGGSSGGGSSDGGSSGGGMGMPGGGSSGGGSSGGGMGMPGGGSSGGGATGSTMPSGDVQMPGGGMGSPDGGDAGSSGGEECQDGGITGGGFGGGAGCDPSGGVGQFPGDPDRAEELGEELDKSIGDFDEALGEEQRKVASVGRDTEGFGDGSGGAGGTIGLGEQAAGASSSSGGGSGAGGAAGGGASQAGPLDGMSDQEIQARTPDDIEVAAYDDIVARQLREAATAEDDPELRERLWEEYRKYKGLK